MGQSLDLCGYVQDMVLLDTITVLGLREKAWTGKVCPLFFHCPGWRAIFACKTSSFTINFVSFCYQLFCCYCLSSYLLVVSSKLFLSQLGMSAICLSLEGMGTGKQLVVFHFSGSTKLRNSISKPRQSHFLFRENETLYAFFNLIDDDKHMCCIFAGILLLC